MKISRENYEIWFIDWLDNKLTGAQSEELNYFLDENPDLRDEFNDLCALNLTPRAESFPGKKNLHRSSHEMTETQFEMLCAASAENDLDEDQKSELSGIISQDPEKNRTIEIYKRLRLKAPGLIFQNKKKLTRLTLLQKAYRIAWTGLSAAAVIALVLMTGVLKHPGRQEVKPVLATEDTISSPVKKAPGEQDKIINAANTQRPAAMQIDSTAVRVNSRSYLAEQHRAIEKVEVPGKVSINTTPLSIEDLPHNTLIASRIEIKPAREGDTDNERSNIGRFIAQRFRSKVLDEPEPSDKPLKGYEIAEAGIEGLNKLLGWDMVLTTKNDENGDVKSLSFNSRMLKFNAPVKNNGSSE